MKCFRTETPYSQGRFKNWDFGCGYMSCECGGMAQSVQRLAKGWTVWGSNPGGEGGGEIYRTRPDRPWGPPSLLYNAYRVFPGGKAAGTWRWPPTPSIAEVKERIELYFYSPSGLSWPVIRWTVRFTFYTRCELIFQTSRNHLKILGAIRVTQSNFTLGIHKYYAKP